MALDDMLVEELGIGPIWVRRGLNADTSDVASASGAAIQGDETAQLPAHDALSAQSRHNAVASSAVDARGEDTGTRQAPARVSDETAAASVNTVLGEVQTRSSTPSVHAATEGAVQTREMPTSGNAAIVDSDTSPSPESSNKPGSAVQAKRPEDAPSDLKPPFFDPTEALPWTDDEPAPVSRVAADIAQDDVHTLDWPALEARVSDCQRCRLCERRTNTVFGVGDHEADWMLIGEAPGENEDKQGEPFVGQAGKLLDNMLRALTLSRESNVYIANVIKCRPPGNRNPELDEVARCESYLHRQVELVKPKVIVALGRFAAQSLLKSEGSIASMRGRIHEYQGVPVVVTYHPAYLLRSLPDKAKAWADLCLARGAYRDALAKLGVEPSGDTAKKGAR